MRFIGIEKWSFVNASQKPGKFKFSKEDRNFLESCCAGHTVIALGKSASKSLKKIGVEHFVLPHPSGLNRLINDKELVFYQLELCKAYIDRAAQ